MKHAMKLGRFSSQKSPSLSSSFGSSSISSKNCVRLVQAGSDNEHKQSNLHSMDKTTAFKISHHEETTIHRNVMEESFGEGYSTRSDDEGFGGIYGGNDECNTTVSAQHDSSQGSEVKEKEKGRNQTQLKEPKV